VEQRVWLIRHGETEWSRTGQHTGRTDLPLTPDGRARALQLRDILKGHQFALVLTSPLQRAVETCRLAGFGDIAQIDPNVREWDYGDYEGLTTAEIRAKAPDWSLWKAGPLNGETLKQVAARAGAVIDRVLQAKGDVALFSHGHFLRVLAACWTQLPPDVGRVLALSAGSVSRLGYERETRVIQEWNRE
jgi:broad specificity phosphatase PhoE